MVEIPDSFYKSKITYSITLNPTDQYQALGKEGRWDIVSKLFRKELNKVKGNIYVVLEYSEPRGMKTSGYAGPRIHGHGIITFPKNRQLDAWLETDMYNLLRWCSVDIDTIQDPEIWYNYMHKQRIRKHNMIANYAHFDDPFVQQFKEVSSKPSGRGQRVPGHKVSGPRGGNSGEKKN